MNNNLSGRSLEETVPQVSVVICTRNRGASIVQTLDSVFANEHPSFEVIVVDQSTNQETEVSVEPFRSDPRFRYIRSDTVGTGRSRNIGLRAARGDIVAYTDDDCTVPQDWLGKIVAVFQDNDRIAVLYCQVVEPPTTAEYGFTPTFLISEAVLFTSVHDCLIGIGLGAGMAVKKSALLEFGGFDNRLGPGSEFMSGEDHDIALRALIYGWYVYLLPDAKVVHYGFRSMEQYRSLARRDWFSLGAVYAKYLKRSRWEVLPLVYQNGFKRPLLDPLMKILHFHKPRGIRNFYFVLQGLAAGLRASVVDRTLLYSET